MKTLSKTFQKYLNYSIGKILSLLSSVSALTSTFTAGTFAPAADGVTASTLTYTARDAESTVLAGKAVTFVAYRRLADAAEGTLITSDAEIETTTGTATLTGHCYDTTGDPLVGITPTLASTGSNNTITAVDSVTNINGRFRWTFSSTTAEAKTLTMSIAGLAVTDTALVTATGAPAAAWFEEAWDYTDTTEMASDPNNWFEADTRTHPSDTAITLTTGLTTPWGGTTACRGTFEDMTGYSCGTEPELGKNILLPDADVDQPREIWVEFYLRFSANWEVTFSCGSYDHKTMFVTQKRKEPEGLNYRWRFSTGNGPDQGGVQPMVFNDPNSGVNRWLRDPAGSSNENDDMSSRAELWDAEWHRCRAHLKMSSAYAVADGEFQFWINDTLAVDVSNYQSAGDDVGGSRPVVDEYFQRLALGRNMNERPEQEQWFEYGRIRVYDTDPGWA